MEELTLSIETEQLFDELERVLGKLVSVAGFDLDAVADLDDDTVVLVRDYFKLMKACKELAINQAKQLDKIDKLEKIKSKLDSIEKLLKEKK